MKKFFDKVEQALFEKAVENGAGDFTYTLETGKYLINVTLDIESKKVVSIKNSLKSYHYYKVSDVQILDENEDNIASSFPLSVEILKCSAPSLEEVENYIEESEMSYEEIYFGSKSVNTCWI